MKNLFDELYTLYLKEIGLKEISDISCKPYGKTYQRASSFSELFKTQVGISPRDFQKRL